MQTCVLLGERDPDSDRNPQPVDRHFAVDGAQNRRPTVLVAQGRSAPPAVGLLGAPSCYLLRNQHGLHLGQKRSPLCEGQTS